MSGPTRNLKTKPVQQAHSHTTKRKFKKKTTNGGFRVFLLSKPRVVFLQVEYLRTSEKVIYSLFNFTELFPNNGCSVLVRAVTGFDSI